MESKQHINYLELLAVWLTILSLCKTEKNCHFKVLSDNTTAVAYLNNMGGTKELCNKIAQKIWHWCYYNKNWITATHLSGKQNVVAGKHSRSVHDNMEWELNPSPFQLICNGFGMPEIDLFANRLNHKLPRYYSWKPDPGTEAVDALSNDWSQFYFYAFPPFNMIGSVLRKVEEERANGIIVVPMWPTQSWFSKFIKMCANAPRILYRRGLTIVSHCWRKEESLPSARLFAAHISARELATPPGSSSWLPGGKAHVNNMRDIYK